MRMNVRPIIMGHIIFLVTPFLTDVYNVGHMIYVSQYYQN